MQSKRLEQPDLCLVGRGYAGKAACLRDLSGRAALGANVDREDVLGALMRREALGSTGLGGGIALPHARLSAVRSPFVLFASLKEAIPFEAVDDRPVDLVCVILLPEEPSTDHLPLLSQWARLLQNKELVQAIRRARSHEALLRLLDVS